MTKDIEAMNKFRIENRPSDVMSKNCHGKYDDICYAVKNLASEKCITLHLMSG